MAAYHKVCNVFVLKECKQKYHKQPCIQHHGYFINKTLSIKGICI